MPIKTPSQLKTSNPARTRSIGRIFHSGLWLIAAAITQPAHAVESAVDQHQLGTKYSPLKQINKDNVANLEKAWEYHTGDLPPKDLKNAFVAFEDQPSMIEGNLVVCSVARRIIALDPQTGKQRWVFDPKDP